MSIKVQIPTVLRQHTDGKGTVEAAGATVQEVLDDVGRQFPGITPRIFEAGQLKRYVNVYLNDDDIRFLDNLTTPVKDGDDLAVIPGVSGADMAREEQAGEVPEGAAVFPDIPEDLGVDPLLLASLHATVFLLGSSAEVVHPDAADEALGAMAEYLRRLEGERLRAVREDMACLVAFGRQEQWPRQLIQALRSFLSDVGVGEDGENGDGEEMEDE